MTKNADTNIRSATIIRNALENVNTLTKQTVKSRITV